MIGWLLRASALIKKALLKVNASVHLRLRGVYTSYTYWSAMPSGSTTGSISSGFDLRNP
jgi:hypothetical protein